jgi:hypothetical protein
MMMLMIAAMAAMLLDTGAISDVAEAFLRPTRI